MHMKLSTLHRGDAMPISSWVLHNVAQLCDGKVLSVAFLISDLLKCGLATHLALS